jgi:hypothetical protein
VPALLKKAVASLHGHEREVSFLFSHLLVPLIVLCMYFAASTCLLPAGVNRVFVTRSGGYALPVVGLLSVVLLVLVGPGRRRRSPADRR